MMNKEFIPYEEALALKELGFDEDCFGYYSAINEGRLCRFEQLEHKYCRNSLQPLLTAILYQQAFRWFREKYGLDSWVYRPDEKLNIWGYNTTLHNNVAPFKTYEEAELECLKQLIKIVKEKNND